MYLLFVVLSSGYTECMNLLMRYPPTSDISYIIKKALHLKDPSVCIYLNKK